MKTSELTYSVVLPAYLEEENLRLLLPRLKDTLAGIESKTGEYSEILVVDTTSPLDATEQACTELGVRFARRSPTNVFGDAVRTGIREARGKWILFMDADGSHQPEFIAKMIEASSQSDIVIASRYTSGGYTENDASLVWMSRILNWTYSVVLNLHVKDVSNSFKLYRAPLLKELTLHCNNFDIVEEILYKICKKNKSIKITELPFTFKKRMFGETKRNLFAFMLTYVVTIVRLRFTK